MPLPTLKKGKPYIWVTWLAALLGGRSCVWAVWFKARYTYTKYETQASDLARWNVEHNALMKKKQAELEALGYKCTVEDDNAFKLEGEVAVLAGKPDLIGLMLDRPQVPDHSICVDGKTGRRKDSDFWQVLLYLFAFPLCRKDLPPGMTGEIHYKQGEDQLIEPGELTDARRQQIVDLIKVIGNSAVVPQRSPSQDECFKCNIGPADCPQRHKGRKTAEGKSSAF